MASDRFNLSWPGGGISLDRCRVMGILNVTPDSFSDGGRFLQTERAVARAWEIAREGADILDVGAESTRPGAEAVSEEEERARLWPLLEKLAAEKYPLPVSLDTTKPAVAREALRSGWVRIINDVEGLRNPDMLSVVRETGAPVVIMHMFGKPRTMQQDYRYGDVVADLLDFFRMRLAETGLQRNVVLDPGFGFGKSVQHNLILLDRLREFTTLDYPLLIGASRKSFIGKTLGLETEDRLEGSLAAAAIAVYNGASIIRAHDVAATVRAVNLAQAVRHTV